MGLDYSFVLFFPQKQRFTALEYLAKLTETEPDKYTSILFPDKILLLPYEAWSDTPMEILSNDPSPSWDFMTVMFFQPDAEIEDWYERSNRGYSQGNLQKAGLPLDEQGRVGIGFIYLTVYNQLQAFAENISESDWAVFVFSAATSGMSILFCEFDSIRQTFARMLWACQGIYGLIDLEDEAEVFWWQGSDVSVRIPHASMNFTEIESIVEGQ